MISRKVTGLKLLLLLLLTSCSFIMFRSSAFTNTVTPYQLVSHKLKHSPTTIGLNNYYSATIQNTNGFILSLKYWEQQTNGLLNFRLLQCLGNIFGLNVVEPFVDGSFLKFPFNTQDTKLENMLRMSDLIDIQVWNEELAALYGYQPVASWESFLTKAPRNIIINCIKYPSKDSPSKNSLNFRYGCPNGCYKQFDAILLHLFQFGFKLVKKACSNFINFSNASVSVEDFGENMFGEYNPANVTVIIDTFRGIRIKKNDNRVPLSYTYGFERKLPPTVIASSMQIMKDADQFISQHLNGKQYLSVLVRIELAIRHDDFEVCADKLMNQMKKTVNESRKSISDWKIFLTMDVGRFGSDGANKKNLQSKGEVLFNKLFKGSNLTFEEWEETFAKVASSDNIAYVANLQRTIATRGECMFMLGGGSFQSIAKKLYDNIHPEPTRCVINICG